MTRSKGPTLSATIFSRKHSWKNFFCGASSSDHWVDGGTPMSSFILPIPQECDEEDEEDEIDESNELASPSEYLERQTLLSSSHSKDDGFEDGKFTNEKFLKTSTSSYSNSSSSSTNSPITQFFIDLWRQPFSAPSSSTRNYDLYSDEEYIRSSSMYEIGGTSSNPYGTSPKSHEPYQKMVCQLTHSNNNLLHENERLSHRVKQLEMAMREQSELLNSIYYTLFRNGINTVAFPDGEEIHLSQFRGQLLTFGKSNAASPRAPLQKTVNGLTGFTAVLRDRQQGGSVGGNEKTSDFSSESSLSSGSVDQDELKAAMLKCITKTKYKNNDFDDFVNWLNDSGVQSARFEPDRKSRSLEEHMQESLRVRQPLQRSSRIEHARSESELVEGQRPSSEHSVPQSLLAIPESSSQQRPSTSGSLKAKALRHRAQSVAAGKINGFLGSRRTSSCVRQNTEPRNSQRKSLANLASMRAASSSNSRQPARRNLI